MNPTNSRDFCKCVGAFRTRERIVHWTQEVIANIARDACAVRAMSSPRVKLMSSLVFNPRFFSPCTVPPLRLQMYYVPAQCRIIGKLGQWSGTVRVSYGHMFWALTERRQRHGNLQNLELMVLLLIAVGSVCTSPLCRQNTVPGRHRCVRCTDTSYWYAGFLTAHLSYWIMLMS